MRSQWQITDLYGDVHFVRGEESPAGGERIEPRLAALEVASWFPTEEPGRDTVELLGEMCAIEGMIPLDAARDVDLLRERLKELLAGEAVRAYRMPPPAAPVARAAPPQVAPPPPPSEPPPSEPPPSEPPPEEKPPCMITSETKAQYPTNRTRTKVGVGEEVYLTVSPGPATWKIVSGKGKLSPAGSQTKVKFTAPEKKSTVVIEATAAGGTCSITFTVVEPSSWIMKKQKGTNLNHTQGRPDCGWKGIMYVRPKDVNFYRIETREKDSQFVGHGSYSGFTGDYHGGYPLPDRASAWFPIVHYSETLGSTDNAPDEIYTGDPGEAATGKAPPFTAGDGYFPITIQWRVIAGTIRDFAATNQEAEIFADGKCESRKGSHTEHTMHNDPTSTY